MVPGRTFLVESYLPARGPRFADEGERARSAAVALSAGGLEVRHVASLYVPSDELALHVFDAASAEHAVDAARAAGLVFERVVEALLVAGCPAGRMRAPPTGAATGSS